MKACMYFLAVADPQVMEADLLWKRQHEDERRRAIVA